MKKCKLTAEDLRFVSQNQQLSGFSGKITPATAAHEPDMDAIAGSAKRFGAQLPGNRAKKPVINKFGQS